MKIFWRELFGNAANALSDQFQESTLRTLSKLIVARGFLAHDESSAAVARVEPLAARNRRPACAIKANPGAHLDERSALRQHRRFFVSNADKRRSLIVLQDSNRTHRDLVAAFGLTDLPPVAGGEDHQPHNQDRSQHDCGKDEKGLFQGLASIESEMAKDNVVENRDSVNTPPLGVRPNTFPKNRWFCGDAFVLHPQSSRGGRNPNEGVLQPNVDHLFKYIQKPSISSFGIIVLEKKSAQNIQNQRLAGKILILR